MFESIKKRLRELVDAPGEIKRRAAPRIEAKLRADATTRRGNVPAYGRLGSVPIRTEVRPEAIVVTGPDFVMEKAAELGQPAAWVEIIQEETAKVLRGGR